MVMTVKPDMTKIWAATGATAVPPDAKIASGWGYEMMPFEWENWIQNRNDSMLSHINQRGIPEWDAASEYFANKSYVTGSNGLVYTALVDNTNVNPVSDVTGKWVRAFPSTTGGGASGTWAISVSGNAATATQFATARTINGVSFNGTANIIVEPYVERDDATNAVRYLSFVDSSTAGHQRLNVDLDLTYNPSTNTISTSVTGNSGTATKWATARSISITGDATWTTSIDGSADATGVLTLANSGVTAGTYNNVATAVTPITVDAKGRVTATGAAVTITPPFSNVTGKPTTLSGYGITDGQPLDAELTAISGLTTNGIIAKTADGAATTRSIAVSGIGIGISNADGVSGDPTVTSNATPGNTINTIVSRDASGNFSAGVVTATLVGNASTASSATYATSATALATGRTIGMTGDVSWTSASFDGSANVTGTATLANSGVTAGTYKSVTVDVKGRVTAGSNPTTLSGYGITDAAPKNSPALTGVPTAPTASAGTNTTQIATTAFVTSAVAAPAVGRLLNVRVFTAANSGSTYTPTAGTTSVIIEAVGAGGGGGGAFATNASQYSYGTGGDCGKYGKARFTSGFSGVTLTIGSGGTGVAGATGNAGGSTSFGSALVCPGGYGGACINPTGTSQITMYSTPPSPVAVTGANIMSHIGFKGAGGMSNGMYNTNADSGCSSYLGGGGIPVGLGNAGSAATGYGGGGSGACNDVSSAARAGGKGGDGVIIVYEYA